MKQLVILLCEINSQRDLAETTEREREAERQRVGEEPRVSVSVSVSVSVWSGRMGGKKIQVRAQ